MGTNGTFATSGNIVLTHEINNETMSMAVENLPKIIAAYKQVIDVATCYNISYPYFEDVEWTSVLNATNSSASASTSASSAASGSDASSSSAITTAAQVNAATSGAMSVIPNLAMISAFIATLLF